LGTTVRFRVRAELAGRTFEEVFADIGFSGDPNIASDAVAEAFAQALQGAERIRSPTDWVWRVTFRIAAGELDRRRRFAAVQDPGYEIDERPQTVVAALAGLSPRQRATVIPHYYGGYTAREVPWMMGGSAATVAVHLHRARKRLRHLLEDVDG
jgi:RNA polymerase sigma-70 factor (ECF subfamily)